MSSNEHKNYVTTRYYIKGKLILASPLIIGCDEDDTADIQCIRNGNGDLFIPGTTLVGNIRNYLIDRLDNTNQDLIAKYFGSAESNSEQSSFIFFDAFSKSSGTELRDGVKLDTLTKTVEDKKKYDYEVIKVDSVFEMRIAVNLREDSVSSNKAESIICKIIDALRTGEIRIGAKTNRGFGKVLLEDTKVLKLELPKDAEKWIEFDWNDVLEDTSQELVSDEIEFIEPDSFELAAEFKIPDSLIVRAYSTDPNDPDAVMLTSPIGSKNPVIPGTSWNGAIRHALFNIGFEIDKESEMEELVKKLFGDVDDKQGNNRDATVSKIRIDESNVKDGKMFICRRTKIDRFTGGAVDSALFDEKPVFEGTTTLRCRIKNPEEYEKQMLVLAVKELQYGIQTVGGESAIGRGRLQLSKLEVDGGEISEDELREYSFDALSTKLNTEEV